MGDFRIIYGRAMGRMNNFFVRTDGLAVSGDTTPDVTEVGLLYTANTSTTAITYFDVRTPHGNNLQGGQFEGKELRVIFLDDSTSLTRSAQLIVNGDATTIPANTVIDFILHTSSWLEVNRSVNQSNIVTVESKNLTGSTTSLGTGGVSVLGKSVIKLIATTGSNCIVRTALNGYPGQVITLIATGASDALVIVNSASNIDGTFCTTTTGGGTQFRLMSSGAISFIKNGIRWHEIRQVSGNSSGDLQ